MSGFSKKNDNRENKTGMLSRLRQGLAKTRSMMFSGIEELFRHKNTIDAGLLEEIETRLLMADLGVEATERILQTLREASNKNQLNDLNQLAGVLQARMQEILSPVEIPLTIAADNGRPFVILVIGVNGSGKTTTIGKLAKCYLEQGKTVLLAAGDTFRHRER